MPELKKPESMNPEVFFLFTRLKKYSDLEEMAKKRSKMIINRIASILAAEELERKVGDDA